MSFTLWFTGLSGSGKSTLSSLVYLELKRRSLAAEWIDGDIIRANFSQELGFSKRDRDINVRRIGFVSHLLTKNRVISVVAAIAPYAEARQANQRLIGNYIEVFCACPLAVAEKRDAKGLYAKARAGLIPNFTGVTDPYEEPEAPEIVVHTDLETPAESMARILTALEARDAIPSAAECVFCQYTEEDERQVREGLASMGYAKK